MWITSVVTQDSFKEREGEWQAARIRYELPLSLPLSLSTGSLGQALPNLCTPEQLSKFQMNWNIKVKWNPWPLKTQDCRWKSESLLNATKESGFFFFFSAYNSESSKHRRNSSTLQLWHFLIPQSRCPVNLVYQLQSSAVGWPKTLLTLPVLFVPWQLPPREGSPKLKLQARKCTIGIKSLSHAPLLKMEMKSYAHTWLGQDDPAGHRSDINDCGTAFAV